jgi:hypothetical protein
VREDVASADPEQLVDTALGRADDRASGAMELYFSHSYCDVSIHSYFVNELAGCGFQLLADQKSPVWCVAKLERYIAELPGFLSIIPAIWLPTPQQLLGLRRPAVTAAARLPTAPICVGRSRTPEPHSRHHPGCAQRAGP